jgi:UDPglucose 6-dehydrogenase
MLPGAVFCRDAYHALDGADVMVVLTEWDDFAKLDLARAAGRMRKRLMVDFRNLYSPSDVTAAGIDYVSLGRPAASAGRERGAVFAHAEEGQSLQRAVAE